MAANGVSHHTVEDDLAGVEAMLKWLAFVPATFPASLPLLRSTDPIGRAIEYAPQQGMQCALFLLDLQMRLTGKCAVELKHVCTHADLEGVFWAYISAATVWSQLQYLCSTWFRWIG